MNEFRDPPSVDPSPNDPLERLIDAFVGQSAPEGPDEVTQRRMLAAMTALASEPPSIGSSDATAVEAPRVASPVVVIVAQPRLRFSPAARQMAAIAATVLVLVAAASAFLRWRPAKPTTPSGPTIEELMAVVPELRLSVPTAAESSDEEGLAVGTIAPRGRVRDGQKLLDVGLDVFEQVAKDHELSESKSWQFAQERISDALERPRVIGMGVGLLGTLPWATFGRF